MDKEIRELKMRLKRMDPLTNEAIELKHKIIYMEKTRVLKAAEKQMEARKREASLRSV